MSASTNLNLAKEEEDLKRDFQKLREIRDAVHSSRSGNMGSTSRVSKGELSKEQSLLEAEKRTLDYKQKIAEGKMTLNLNSNAPKSTFCKRSGVKRKADDDDSETNQEMDESDMIASITSPGTIFSTFSTGFKIPRKKPSTPSQFSSSQQIGNFGTSPFPSFAPSSTFPVLPTDPDHHSSASKRSLASDVNKDKNDGATANTNDGWGDDWDEGTAWGNMQTGAKTAEKVAPAQKETEPSKSAPPTEEAFAQKASEPQPKDAFANDGFASAGFGNTGFGSDDQSNSGNSFGNHRNEQKRDGFGGGHGRVGGLQGGFADNSRDDARNDDGFVNSGFKSPSGGFSAQGNDRAAPNNDSFSNDGFGNSGFGNSGFGAQNVDNGGNQGFNRNRPRGGGRDRHRDDRVGGRGGRGTFRGDNDGGNFQENRHNNGAYRDRGFGFGANSGSFVGRNRRESGRSRSETGNRNRGFGGGIGGSFGDRYRGESVSSRSETGNRDRGFGFGANSGSFVGRNRRESGRSRSETGNRNRGFGGGVGGSFGDRGGSVSSGSGFGDWGRESRSPRNGSGRGTSSGPEEGEIVEEAGPGIDGLGNSGFGNCGFRNHNRRDSREWIGGPVGGLGDRRNSRNDDARDSRGHGFGSRDHDRASGGFSSGQQRDTHQQPNDGFANDGFANSGFGGNSNYNGGGPGFNNRYQGDGGNWGRGGVGANFRGGNRRDSNGGGWRNENRFSGREDGQERHQRAQERPRNGSTASTSSDGFANDGFANSGFGDGGR